jgi:tetratricopeptide (TPR) repeat protein
MLRSQFKKTLQIFDGFCHFILAYINGSCLVIGVRVFFIQFNSLQESLKLARIYLNSGEQYKEAVELVKKGLELNPKEENLPLGYFLLADLYNRLGEPAKSKNYAQKGQALVRKNKNH